MESVPRFGPFHEGRGTTDSPPYTPDNSVFSGVWRSFVFATSPQLLTYPPTCAQPHPNTPFPTHYNRDRRVLIIHPSEQINLWHVNSQAVGAPVLTEQITMDKAHAMVKGKPLDAGDIQVGS